MLYLDKITEGEVRRDDATDAGMIHEKADMARVSATYPGTPWNQECVRMRSWNVLVCMYPSLWAPILSL